MSRGRFIGAVAVAGLLAAAGNGGARARAAADPTPFGLTCTPVEGVRFCPGNSTTERVPSFDGVLIDADVTLPATGDGPWPTIVLLNGLGGDKTQLQTNVPDSTGLAPRVLPNVEHYGNIWYASRGYATVAISTRGFGESCGGGGFPTSLLQPPPCDRGFVRVADSRYEPRDVQYLLGLLVDQGITIPDRLGATGFSYGGGIAVELGYLNDRVRCDGTNHGPTDPCAGQANGAFVPWTSPAGVPMRMAGIYGQWLWSDLIASLLPNGRFLDFDDATLDSSTEPLGVLADSYVRALFGLAQSEGYIVRPQLLPTDTDQPWDLVTAVALLELGEPYGATPGPTGISVQEIAEEFHRFHGGFGIPGTPAPMLLESGWVDDLFPVAESLRVYNDLQSRFENPDVALLLGDLGHGRDANKQTVGLAFNDLATAFFDEHLRDFGSGPAPGGVTAYTTTCPAGPDGPPDGGPFTAASWPELHPRTITLLGGGAQTVSFPGGDPNVGLMYDPITQLNPLGAPNPCRVSDDVDAAGDAVYRMTSDGFTMMGLPTIRATIATTGPNGQLVGRLWDVAPDGTRVLVTRGVYRLTDGQTGPLVFQLHGNGYAFAAGNTVKLELTGSDSPQYRPSNGVFSVVVSDVAMEMPALAAAVDPAVPRPGAPAPAPDSTAMPPTGASLVLWPTVLIVLVLLSRLFVRTRDEFTADLPHIHREFEGRGGRSVRQA